MLKCLLFVISAGYDENFFKTLDHQDGETLEKMADGPFLKLGQHTSQLHQLLLRYLPGSQALYAEGDEHQSLPLAIPCFREVCSLATWPPESHCCRQQGKL